MSRLDRACRPLVLAVALAVVRCGGDEPHGPYVTTVDLRAEIEALGEETLTADEAADRLVVLGPAAVAPLAAALAREPGADVRQKAVEVLAEIGTPEVVPPLLDAARDDTDPTVRGEALRALATLGDPRATPVLEASLDAAALAVRAGAVVGCAALCSSPPAIEQLADLALDDSDGSLAVAARTTLATIRARGPEEEARVRAAVGRRRPATLPATASANARALAALLASDVDGAAGIPALEAAVDAAPPMQRQIAWRLGELGDERGVAVLGTLLASPDPTVRLYAYDALVKLGSEDARALVTAYTGPRPPAPLDAPQW